MKIEVKQYVMMDLLIKEQILHAKNYMVCLLDNGQEGIDVNMKNFG